METRKIGSLAVSVVGLGCNNFGMRVDEKRSGEVIGAALDAGINFFDTADMYANGKSEEGKGIAPDIYVVNTKEDIDSGKDKVLEFAMSRF